MAKRQPTDMQKWVARAIVGAGVTYAAAKLVKGAGLGPQLVIGVLGMVGHEMLDAPVAQVIADIA